MEIRNKSRMPILEYKKSLGIHSIVEYQLQTWEVNFFETWLLNKVVSAINEENAYFERKKNTFLENKQKNKC